MMKYTILILLLCSAWVACNNADVAKVPKTAVGNLYFDYRVWGEEGNENATVRLQFKAGGEEGRAVPVEKPGRVLLDSVLLEPDSTKFYGTYYELIKPLAELKGRHTITMVDENGQAHRETFLFQPFELAEVLPEEIAPKAFSLHLQNFPAAPTRVRLVMIDTSLQSSGINEVLLVKDGKLAITEAMLLNLATGPVTMEIAREEEQPIKSGTNTRGRLLINYGLRRQFELVD